MSRLLPRGRGLSSVVLGLLAAATTACSMEASARPISATGPGPALRSTASTVMPGVTRYPAAGRRAVPAVGGTTLDRGHLGLASLRGSIVVVNAWASWCDPCRREVPALARLGTENHTVRLVGLDEHDTNSAARGFAHSVGMTYPSLVDRDGTLLSRLTLLPPTAIPSTLIVDRHGRMAARIIGPVTSTALRGIISDLDAEG